MFNECTEFIENIKTLQLNKLACVPLIEIFPNRPFCGTNLNKILFTSKLKMNRND